MRSPKGLLTFVLVGLLACAAPSAGLRLLGPGLVSAVAIAPWYVAASTSALGVVSKYLFRTRSANVFNPAALALVGTFYVFDSGHSWWGALPELPPAALAVLLATGMFITDRVNKTPLVLMFLGGYYLLFTATAFMGDPGRRRDLSAARSARGPVLRVFHPDRSADLACQIP